MSPLKSDTQAIPKPEMVLSPSVCSIASFRGAALTRACSRMPYGTVQTLKDFGSLVLDA